MEHHHSRVVRAALVSLVWSLLVLRACALTEQSSACARIVIGRELTAL